MSPVTASSDRDAAPGSAAIERARELFREGVQLAKQGVFHDALLRFERSEVLHPHAVATYNRGYCERALGHATRARKLFAQAIADSAQRAQDELPADMASAAQGYIAELETQIAHLSITLDSEGASLQIDGRPLEPRMDEAGAVLIAGTRDVGPGELLAFTSFELQLDPGVHAFVLSRAGREPVSTTVDVAAGERRALSLALGKSSTVASRPARSDRPAVARSIVRAERAREPNHLPAYATWIAGGAGLLTGAITGTLAWTQAAELEGRCTDKTCVGRDGDALDRAHTMADVSTAAFVIGGAGVVAGSLLWWLSDRDGEAPLRAGSMAATLRGRF